MWDVFYVAAIIRGCGKEGEVNSNKILMWKCLSSFLFMPWFLIFINQIFWGPLHKSFQYARAVFGLYTVMIYCGYGEGNGWNFPVSNLMELQFTSNFFLIFFCFVLINLTGAEVGSLAFYNHKISVCPSDQKFHLILSLSFL